MGAIIRGTTSSSRGGVSISGDKELDKALYKFERRVRENISRKAIRKASNIFTKAARVNAQEVPYPKVGAALKKAIKTRVSMKGRGGGHRGKERRGRWLVVGRTYVDLKGNDPPYWAVFFEFGTDQRVVKRLKTTTGAIMQGVESGSIKPYHFVREAFTSNDQKALEVFRSTLRQLIRQTRAGA